MNRTKQKIKTIITEEHSSQLHVWHKLGWKNATLIYLDEHLDFQYISEHRIEALKRCQTSAEVAQLENYPELSFNIGLLFMKNKNYQTAISFFEKALTDESTKAKTHKILGKIYLEQGQYQLAQENLILATEIIPTDEQPVKLLAKLYKEIGDETNYHNQMLKYYQMKFMFQSFNL
ncbi:hypothetical protein WA1_13370 [Scytonema hofmannii PCC 7110]|uniref:Uncharacterized protein n=1 Tax=Scytonema hofmannii PCC 7110 TaxID=128403 RepID=A0A139XEI5_9CYAN|nr:tetratricopeptide repeat protein [Scytonema hofmannii]KYC43086.1 hypothetical protein WA1_13370 [Scytonema hofmannii PCC 7110]